MLKSRKLIKLAAAAALGIGIALSTIKRDEMLQKYLTTVRYYQTWKAAHYLPELLKRPGNNWTKNNDLWIWNHKNIIFVVQSNIDLLTILKEDVDEHGSKVIRRFSLIDDKQDGSIDAAKIDTLHIDGKVLKYKMMYVSDPVELLPFQYDYAFFLQNMHYKRLDRIEKRYPQPKIHVKNGHDKNEFI